MRNVCIAYKLIASEASEKNRFTPSIFYSLCVTLGPFTVLGHCCRQIQRQAISLFLAPAKFSPSIKLIKAKMLSASEFNNRLF